MITTKRKKDLSIKNEIVFTAAPIFSSKKLENLSLDSIYSVFPEKIYELLPLQFLTILNNFLTILECHYFFVSDIQDFLVDQKLAGGKNHEF